MFGNTYSSYNKIKTVPDDIQFLKAMYIVVTIQIPLPLPMVFSMTDSVFCRGDALRLVPVSTIPRDTSGIHTFRNWIISLP